MIRENLSHIKRQVRVYGPAYAKRHRTPRYSVLVNGADKRVYFSATVETADGGSAVAIEKTCYQAWYHLREHLRIHLTATVQVIEDER